MLTELEARIYLAEKLPERIITEHLTRPAQTNLDGTKHEAYSEYKFRWLDKGNWPERPEILETEWQQIALWVEENMAYEQWDCFDFNLTMLAPANLSGIQIARWKTQSNYITRATAMKEAGISD